MSDRSIGRSPDAMTSDSHEHTKERTIEEIRDRKPDETLRAVAEVVGEDGDAPETLLMALNYAYVAAIDKMIKCRTGNQNITANHYQRQAKDFMTLINAIEDAIRICDR